MATKGKYQIPFDKDGNLLHQVYRWHDPSQYSLVDNYLFTDTLEYSGYGTSRSSCYVYLKSISSGRKFHMSMHEFDVIIKRNLFQNNRITGDFTFAKRGNSYFLTPILENNAGP